MSSDQPDRLAATLALDESVGRVRLVSPTRARALDGLGVRTVRDLVTHFPRRYIDLSRKATVATARIGEQCTVEGTVENSILFRGVKVGKGTVIRNSIVMQDTVIGDNVSMDYVITDKNVVIRDRRVLAGCDIQPYFLSKGTMI